MVLQSSSTKSSKNISLQSYTNFPVNQKEGNFISQLILIPSSENGTMRKKIYNLMSFINLDAKILNN